MGGTSGSMSPQLQQMLMQGQQQNINSPFQGGQLLPLLQQFLQQRGYQTSAAPATSTAPGTTGILGALPSQSQPSVYPPPQTSLAGSPLSSSTGTVAPSPVAPTQQIGLGLLSGQSNPFLVPTRFGF